jgi:hypothetical protein
MGRLGEVNEPFAAPARRSFGDVPGAATQQRSLAVAETTTALTAAVSTDRFSEADSVFLPRSLSSSCPKGTFKTPNRPSRNRRASLIERRQTGRDQSFAQRG